MEPREGLAPQNPCPLPCDELDEADIDIVVSRVETREERSMRDEDEDEDGSGGIVASSGTVTHSVSSATTRSTVETEMSIIASGRCAFPDRGAHRPSKFDSKGFSFAGPFFHIMLTYGVATEGDGGNSFAAQLFKASNAPFPSCAPCAWPLTLSLHFPDCAPKP
jgi:hypothetical protein